MKNTLTVLVLAVLLAGCNLPAPGVQPPATQALQTPAGDPSLTPLIPSPLPDTPAPDAPASTPAVPDSPTPGETAAPTGLPAATATQPPPQVEPSPTPAVEGPAEAIFIQQPAPGSRVTSPVLVAGLGGPTFEQNLGVQLVLDDGTVLALGPAMIQADLGQRGPFEVLVPFTVSGERQAFIQVFETSARDGGITHLSSVGVTLLETGEVEIREADPHPERIAIFRPALSDRVSGGLVRVEGFALASFEQNLLVEVLDADGNIVGSQSVLVQSPEMGVPGPFTIDVPYQVSAAGPGRVVVRDPSPAFEGDVHVASVEIELAP
jgi:hypothetical protein